MFNVIIMDKKLEYLKVLDANYSLKMILEIKIHNWLGIVAMPLILTLDTLETEAGRFL